jgi:hypothetical protein
MADQFENFARVFAETLSADDLAAFENLLSKKPSGEAIWHMVQRSHVACLDPAGLLIRTGDRKLITHRAFDELFNPIVNRFAPDRYRDRAAKFAISKPIMLRASGIVYEPGQPDWVGTKYNMYRPTACTPLDELPLRIADHIRYLIPDARERKLFVDFLAWMVQNPTRKLQFALLIVGRKGTGKSWLSGLIECLFGPHNVTVLAKGGAIAEKFDTSAENKQAIFIDELVPDGKNDLAKAIKPLITSPTVRIEHKGIDAVLLPNRANVIAISNHPNALKIAADEREWLVVRSAADVRYTDDDGGATDKTNAYYDALFAMTPLDRSPTDEVRRFMNFLQRRDLSGFNGQSLAPMTDAKSEVAEYAETATETQIRTALADKRGPFAFTTFTVADVRDEIFAYYADHADKSPKAIEAEIVAAMEVAGCRRVTSKQSWVNGKPQRIWTHRRHLAKLEKLGPADLAAIYRSERDGTAANDNAGDADATEFA